MQPALQKLQRDADKALAFSPVSVVSKTTPPPSGDKHDYMSLSRYWWPNPATADGLPYVRRDGQVNPAIHAYPDAENLSKLSAAIETLTLAYRFTQQPVYASHAALLVRTWFLDAPTSMHPHLMYAQFIPGITAERGFGILDGRFFVPIIDALGVLADQPSWTPHDQQAMRQWVTQYLTWLRTSPHGAAESRRANNHGSWYLLQVAALALFVGATSLTTQMVEATTHRIANQIEPAGRQPLELERTQSWNYSIFNLQALFALAALGERIGLDLWHFQTTDGRSLRTALDYLVPLPGATALAASATHTA